MKKSLPPAAIAAVIVVFVAAVGTLFVKFGSGDVKGVSMADSMKTTHGNTVNSMTGEPLTESQKIAAERQEAMIRSMQGAGVDPQKRGTAPNMGGRTD